MKVFKRAGLVLIAALMALSMSSCQELLLSLVDILGAPYGYVKNADGTAIEGATVQVYRDSVADANKVQGAVTTSSTGYFTLASQVDTKGGTYVVVVTAPSSASYLSFDNTTVEVPAKGYLYNIGTIRANGGLFAVEGKVVNVRAGTTTTDFPVAGTVEVRKFGETTATRSADITGTGTFSVAGVPNGNYMLTFKDLAGGSWTGIPSYIEVAGGNVTDEAALVYKDVPATALLLVTTWTNTAYDIDSTSMVGAIGSATKVNYANKTLNSGGNYVVLERDVVSGGTKYDKVETTLVNSLAAGTDMRFYAHCYTSAGSVTGYDEGANSVRPAEVTVYAMYNGAHYGTWWAALNTSEKLVRLADLRGNAGGSITIGSAGTNFDSYTTPRSIGGVVAEGVEVLAIE